MDEPKVSIGMDASAAIGMAQRVGLNKVRHIEVDVLWVQEQMARRLLPIAKIPGPRNPSDLCTKNVPVALLEQYLGQINVHFAEGRAAVAQQLHSMAKAHLGGGALLPGKVGGLEEGRVNAAPEVGDLLTGVIGGSGPGCEHCHTPPRARARQPSQPVGGGERARTRTRTAEERGVDSWIDQGIQGKWLRAHRTPRRSLFTPHRVSGGPAAGRRLKGSRITKGTYVGNGVTFTIVDNYHDPNLAHRVLGNAWVGTSEFTEDLAIDNIGGNQKSALRSLSARPRRPGGEGEHVRLNCEPGREADNHFYSSACIEPASTWQIVRRPGRKFESWNPRSGIHASETVIVVPPCRYPILSPATSQGTGSVRGGVRDSGRRIGCSERRHVTYGQGLIRTLGHRTDFAMDRQIPAGFGSRRNAG